MIRHVVIDYRWDDQKNIGYLRFRCQRCGYEYWWKAIHNKYWEHYYDKEKQKFRKRKKRFAKQELKFYAHWWGIKSGAKSDGCSVSSCKGCLPLKKA